MAAVDILRSPLQHDVMPPKQRAPLSNVPLAVNSPLRPNKRARGDGKAVLEDESFPPSKRIQLGQQHVDQRERENIPPNPQTPHKRKPVSTLRLGQGGRSEYVDRERIYRQQVLIAKEKDKAREREAQRDKGLQRRPVKEASQDDLVRWQRYYEKQFPKFTFFFENVPEDARKQCSRQVKELGAAEDRFFSRTITHVITTRPIPNEVNTPIEEEHDASQGTINPSLLDRRTQTLDEVARAPRSRSVFDVALSKKAGLNVSPDRSKPAKLDVLQRARDLGIKIWQLEKLQRILRTVTFDDESDFDEHESHQQAVNARVLARAPAPRKPVEPLSKLIKREEQSKNAAYDAHILKTELVPLREPYIYVRCMNERTKPLLFRQYPKVAKSTDGEWPQFRAVTQGKCPFIIDEKKQRKEKKKEKEKEQGQVQEQRMTRAQAAESQQQADYQRVREAINKNHVDRAQRLQPYEAVKPLANLEQPPAARTRASQRHPTPTIKEEEGENEENEEPNDDETEVDSAVNADEDGTTDAARTTPTEGDFSKAHEHFHHSRQTSFDMMAPPALLPQPNPSIGHPGGEPYASGLQRSGATAAIRSTMGISSAAAQPGIKSGTTRDLHSLQRRVLTTRYNSGSGSALGMSAGVIPTTQAPQPSQAGLVESRRVIDIAGALRPRIENQRAAKIKAQEKIQHRPTEQVRELDRAAQKAAKAPEAAPVRDPKPGYCENCKDKYDDFDEHTMSRKHRKFAIDKNNWTGLDALLAKLERPKKREIEEDSDCEDYDGMHSREDRSRLKRIRLG